MSGYRKDFGSEGDFIAPKSSEADLKVATWNLLSLARDAQDAVLLMERLGIDRSVLLSLKSEVR